MVRVVGALCVMLVIAGVAMPASGGTRDLSRVRLLAVTPFADHNPLTRPLAEWGADRLRDLLRDGRYQVIEARRVAAEMVRQGMRPTDLTSPSRAVVLGEALGADAVLTGRVVEVFEERVRERMPEGGLWIEARVVVDIRVLEVASRLKLFEEEIACSLAGLAVAAMECVVQQAASRLIRR